MGRIRYITLSTQIWSCFQILCILIMCNCYMTVNWSTNEQFWIEYIKILDVITSLMAFCTGLKPLTRLIHKLYSIPRFPNNLPIVYGLPSSLIDNFGRRANNNTKFYSILRSNKWEKCWSYFEILNDISAAFWDALPMKLRFNAQLLKELINE